VVIGCATRHRSSFLIRVKHPHLSAFFFFQLFAQIRLPVRVVPTAEFSSY
jgi:hypothetical protein